MDTFRCLNSADGTTAEIGPGAFAYYQGEFRVKVVIVRHIAGGAAVDVEARDTRWPICWPKTFTTAGTNLRARTP